MFWYKKNMRILYIIEKKFPDSAFSRKLNKSLRKFTNWLYQRFNNNNNNNNRKIG